uniref:Uncharacterized protein n=1 Tax=Arundo donax TaxID=35708 RepID=A0A0A9DFJ2_ARUDO
MSCCWSATCVAANRWLSTRSSWMSWSRATRRSSITAKAGCAAAEDAAAERGWCPRSGGASSLADAAAGAAAVPGARPRRGGLASCSLMT